MSLHGKVALVAGATRGAGQGRGRTGRGGRHGLRDRRTTRDRPSGYAHGRRPSSRPPSWSRPPRQRASPFRSIISSQPKSLALVERIRAEQGRLDFLVNDVWGRGPWGVEQPVREHDLENGLRILSLGEHTRLDHGASGPAG